MNVYDWGFVGGRGGGGYPHEPTQLILMINKSEQQAKKKILKIASSQPKATGGKILRTFYRPGRSFSAVSNRAKKLSSVSGHFSALAPAFRFFRSGQKGHSLFFRPGRSFSAFQTGQKSYRRVSGHFFALAPAFRFFRSGQIIVGLRSQSFFSPRRQLFGCCKQGKKVIVGSQVIFSPSPPLSASSALDKKVIVGLRSFFPTWTPLLPVC